MLNTQSYTFVRGEKKNVSDTAVPLTLLLLNRNRSGNRLEDLQELMKKGFSEIISVEYASRSVHDYDMLARKLPSVRFLLVDKDTGAGEQINMGIREAACQHVAVMWNDMRMQTPLNGAIMEVVRVNNAMCTVPVLHSCHDDLIPSVQIPVSNGRVIKTLPVPPLRSGMDTVFPFDYTGIYNKKIFESVGGYDSRISSPYWQKMDLGFRTYLWGEKFSTSCGIRIFYISDFSQDDITPGADYRRFYLKNLAVKYNGDYGYLPKIRIFSYIVKSGEGLGTAIHRFRAAAEWVSENRFRFRLSSRAMIESWPQPE